MWRYVLVVCLLVSGCIFDHAAVTSPAVGQSPTPNIDQQLQVLWDHLDKGSSTANKRSLVWSPAYSPLFPAEWPPTSNTAWVRYAYAQAVDMDLRDAVRIAAPWAKVEMRGNPGTAAIVSLRDRLEPMTTQGVQPIGSATQAILAKMSDVSAYCLQLTALPNPNSQPATEMRAFYRTWLKYNGAFVSLIQPNHQKFLAWLNE